MFDNSEEHLQLEEQDLSIFEEPEGYLPPPSQPTFHTFSRKEENVLQSDSHKTFSIRLVGSHPLWGHILWNAGKCFAWYLDEHKELIKRKKVLELGAGGALPSLIAAVNGAERVVITDYPDDDLIGNIRHNVITNLSTTDNINILGYIWGKDTSPLLNTISSNLYDLIILSDLIFNHSQHKAILKTCEECLEPINGQVLVFFTHHRPNLANKDMEFFEEAKHLKWKVEKVHEKIMNVMFDKDPGSVIVRSIVHGYKLTINN
ncbi:3586_t:CDS:2 [Funneliformis mosseae]|uniref:Protein N-terminal and lysine N-methyltransferase EFM7 n=1 Tax=Funneliformis mosseae TaxID=27381 RepID=A0A9N9AQU4_FUNMO|nr:3586_t:CDS:2 [Funneliformis mosseae]